MPRKTFLKILSSSLNNTALKVNPALTKEDWSTIFVLGEIHRVLPIMYDKISEVYPFDKSDLESLKRRTKLLVAQQTYQTYLFRNLSNELKKLGLSPIVVKGIICRSIYPDPDYRISTDEDLLVPQKDFNQYLSAFEALSFSAQKEINPNSYQNTFRSSDGLSVELHTSLFPTNSEFFTCWNRTFENCFENAVEINTGDCHLVTLAPTDNLLYLLLHAVKHFLHGGVGIRQICDVLMFATAFGKEINWEDFFTICHKLFVKDFALAIFATGKKHLGFQEITENFPSNIALDSIDEKPLLDDILDSGIFGSTSKARQHSASFTFDAVRGKKTGLIRRAFPKAESLGSKYSYAKKHPLLLPVAWSKRLLKYRKESRLEKDNTPTAILETGKKRLELLNYYKLIPNKQ